MSIVDDAKREMRLAGYEPGDRDAMVLILETFFSRWDSGGAVYVMAPVLQRLIAGKPLGPLTGLDGEWMHIADEKEDAELYQNVRCGTVFKTVHPGGRVYAYDINTATRPAITFPYDPENIGVSDPVVVIETAEDD